MREKVNKILVMDLKEFCSKFSIEPEKILSIYYSYAKKEIEITLKEE